MTRKYLTIGRITKPQGIRGEVIVAVETDFPSRFLEAEVLLVQTGNAAPVSYPVERIRPHKGRFIVKFKDIASRNEAEGLRNADVVIPQEDRHREEDFFYFDELEGMAVRTREDRLLGTVREIMPNPGHDILVVRDRSREILIPFDKAMCIDVDLKNRTITVDLPEGLEDINN